MSTRNVSVSGRLRAALAAGTASLALFAPTLGGLVPSAYAASTLTVTTTADISTCTPSSFSLRCAMDQANKDGSGDTIVFNIPATDPACTSRASNGSPVCTITTNSSFLGLPEVTANNTTINGYTQPGARVNTNPLSSGDNAILTLRVDGGPSFNTEFGFRLSGTGDTVNGFSVTRFTTGISAGGANIIQGNFIGVGPDGSTRLGASTGLEAGDGTTIGGTTPAAANVIGGSNTEVMLGNGDTFQGNIVGLNAAGNKPIIDLLAGGLPGDGVFAGGNDLIGGTAPGSGNVISGNASGIRVAGAGATLNQVQGNLIGTDVTGKVALGNIEGITTGFSASNNTIGGLVPAARNIISGNFNFGIDVGAGSANIVEGNYIGTDITGAVALANGGKNGASAGDSAGVLLASGGNVDTSNDIIGGTTSAARNVISGNAFNGVQIAGASSNTGGTGITQNNLVEGNVIGLDATGTQALGNGTDGVFVANFQGFSGQVLNNRVQNNVIAHNGQSGVLVGNSSADATVHTSISSNAMFANGGLGIDLAPQGVINTATNAPGPNDYLHAPVIAQATTTLISGTAPANSMVEVFVASNEKNDLGHGEGQTFLGSATSSASGTWSLTLAAGHVARRQLVTATTTTSGTTAETSEFAANVTVQ